jgi:hypothetical protein
MNQADLLNGGLLLRKSIIEIKESQMDFSLTNALYEWMHERRIVNAVAREMGVYETTLHAELRPTNHSAKLGADTLIPLCRAIRRLGYGHELDGLLHQFMREMRDCSDNQREEKDIVSQVLTLGRSLGMLAECADRIPHITDEAELVRLATAVRTQVLPTVMQIESIIANQLVKVRKKRKLRPATT